MKIFQPTLISQYIMENVKVNPYELILDLGCGTGVIGKFFQDSGSMVISADIMEEAVKEARAKGLTAIQSDIFSNLEYKFDVIIDDVSGICDEVSKLSHWYPESVPTGGFDGTDKVIRVLSEAKDHLKENGRLYLPISSLSKTEKIMAVAHEHFAQVKLIYENWIPFCKALESNFNLIKDNPNITYKKKGSRHLWKFELYECK